MTWVPLWVLPNISLDEPIESEMFVLAPYGDERVEMLANEHPGFETFRSCFRDVYECPLQPAILLRKEQVPKSFVNVGAAISFRDIISACFVPSAWANAIEFQNNIPRATTSEFFSVFPWTISKDWETVNALTPMTLSLHEPEAIRGHSAPGLSPIDLRPTGFDEPLYRALMRRWRVRYGSRPHGWEDAALFRSLNVAYQACRTPSNSDPTIFDFGSLVGTWVSAFETLAHPGGLGQANASRVYELLDGIPFASAKTAHKRYLVGGKNNRQRRNVACWVYGQLLNARNGFLHGNPVSEQQLKTRTGRFLTHLAPPLYRLALSSFLDLRFRKSIPDNNDTEALVDYMIQKSEFEDPQQLMEKAVRLASISEREQKRRAEEFRKRVHVRVRSVKIDHDE